MKCDVKVTAEEFTIIHNTLWEIEYNGMNAVEGVQKIRDALKGAYAQQQDDFDRKMDHYDQVRKELGLDAIWSIYEIENLSEPHPYSDAKTVTYKDYFTNKDVVKPIVGGTYAALFVTANACIRDSKDNHHRYVEYFEPKGDTLLLTTGS